MKELDNRTIKDFGIPGIVLMENAGRSVAGALDTHYPRADKILVICGRGNNGGDGFVAARTLYESNRDLAIFCFFDRNFRPSGDSGINFDLIKKLDNIDIIYITEIEALKREVMLSHVIVDAVFGTGLKNALEEPYITIFDIVNRSGKPVVSVDIPSGVDGRLGQVLNCAIKADLTVTFGYSKPGHYIYPGREYTGKLLKAPIGLPGHLINNDNHLILAEKEDIRKILKKRRRDSHKGDYGHLCIIGGSRGKLGAVIMSGMAAMKSGAGLVTLGVPASSAGLVNATLFEAMTLYLGEDEMGYITDEDTDYIFNENCRFDSFALGPGLGVSSSTSAFMKKFLAGLKKPAVLDADALNIIAGEKKEYSFLREKEIIMTPHPGELARFFGKKAKDIMPERLFYAVELSREFKAVVVSKGSTNFLVDEMQRTYCIPGDCPQLAKGGAGDVLTGMIGAFLANGYSLCDSALMGVYLHKSAAELASADIHESSLLARELIEYISRGFFSLENF